MAFFGLVPDRPVREKQRVFYLWPENVPYWNLFLACHTQWNHGMDGRTSLNYPGVEVVMQRKHIPPRKRDRAFALMQAMEVGALTGWREQRDKRKG